MSKTLEEIFDLIHKKQAERLLAILESDEPVSPQAFNAINKFLSDNNISGVKKENKALTALSDGLDAYEDEMSGNISMFPPRQG
jgi:hypothetical protein